MSHNSDSRKSISENSDDSNVIQLGFNISVAGKSASDFEIFVNDKKQPCGQITIPNVKQITSAEHSEDQRGSGETTRRRRPLDKLSESEESACGGAFHTKNKNSPSGETEGSKSNRSDDVTIIDEIKNAMGNFEKFSEHLKEIPRLSTKRMYTSTPFPDKNNSRSEGNLSVYGRVPRSYIPKHDFRDRKYFKKPKPLSNDLFLKPLPAEDYFKKGYFRRYYDVESHYQYASMENLPYYYEYGGELKNTGKPTAKSDNDKSDASASDMEIKAIAKKDGSEPFDKQSTSSESTKDIKIYQSGGIIIMQNFKDNTDLIDKDLIDSTKLIENCNKLKEKVEGSLHSSDESQKLLLNSSSDDVKGQFTKFVQFDLSSCENTRSKSCDSPSEMPKNDYVESLKNDVSNIRSELSKGKDSGLIFPSNQDFTSLSTQENDSIISNLLGMSPTSSTSGKKLEWDSGADVGYLNMDLTKENISTIERIILKGLSDDGLSKKEVIYQKTEQEKLARPSKFILERISSELEIQMKDASTSKRSSSDQSSIPSRVTSTSTNTSWSSPDGKVLEKQPGTSSKAEKYHTPSTDKSSKSKNSKKSKVLHNQVAKQPQEKTDDVQKTETSSDGKETNKEEKCVQTPNINVNKETVLSDKSTYVNTLFVDPCFQLPLHDLSKSDESGRSESSEKFKPARDASPRLKKLKKKKNIVQGTNLTARLKDKIETIINIARHSNRSDEIEKPDISAKTSEVTDKKVDDVDVEHVKSDPTSPEKPSQKDKGARSRPISASSSSVRTVMPNVTTPENAKVKNFADQMIQTCDLVCESKGIQAFQSTESSQLGENTTRNIDEIVVDVTGVEVLKQDGLSKSILAFNSKSIQAPGMNSSLPKHLAHPKQTISCEQINTKATQFFGFSGTSLPNYHASMAVKESGLRREKILNISNTENRVMKENVKNASLKQPSENKVVAECKATHEADGMRKKDRNNVDDKENVSVDEDEFTDNSKRQSSCSRKESKGSKKSDSMAFGSCEVLPSDDGRNVFLTSELLKEHGDHIDRNIIQEKYFQSQLLELERSEMVSRSTSMEKKNKHERNTQTSFSPVTGVSVSCQYSPSLINMSEYYSKTDSGKSTKDEPRNAWTYGDGGDECDSPQKRQFSESLILADCLSSDTDNSWPPGTQQGSENQPGRAMSFEYLPGHIYDDPTSLKEESPGDKEHLDTVEQSNGSPATNTRTKNSDSRHTLVLENSDRSTLESSERMKSLNNNLTELEMVVSKLHEKEAIFQKITDSVLSTVSKVNGSGDSSHQRERSKSNDNSNGTEEISGEVEVMEESSKSNGTGVPEKSHVVNEISTACQTDTMKPDANRFDEERKKLEQRMNDEKEQQIKWIENEIEHLNRLRSLLEMQQEARNSTQRKKRHHLLTEASEVRSATATLKEDILRKILTESLSKTPPQAEEVINEEQSPSPKLTEESPTEALKQLSEPSHCPQLGMALSLRKVDNVREVTMLPVGIQVTLRDRKERSRAGTSEKQKDSLNFEQPAVRDQQTATSSTLEFGRRSGTQSSSLNNQYTNNTPTPGSLDSGNRCGCYKCNKSQCVCLKTSESSDRRKSSRSSSQQSKAREDGVINGELPKQGLKIPEIRDIADSRRDSANDSPSGVVTQTSRQEQSYMSSDLSMPFEKCVCICHAQPLPRCDSCHLLNTCKKCQCYRRINSCRCEISASKGSLRRKCMTISTSCLCKADPCKICPCSRVKNQVCGFCPCHLKVVSETCQCKCKKKYKERSCQTEGKECSCCQCSERKESDLYRETKYMSEKQHVTEKRKPSEVVSPAEQRYECESKQSVDEKFPFQMKVPTEKKKSAEVKNAAQMKTQVETLCAEEFQTLPVRELQEKIQCRCKTRPTRRKSADDHPRHYFLQVEETTEDESSESCDNRNSLEVITIKVPIRKVCNGGRNIQPFPQKSSWKTKEIGDGSKYSEQKITEEPECDCCEDCIGHSRKRSSTEERPRTADYSPPRAYDSKRRQQRDKDMCGCCEDCPGRAKLEERPRPEFAVCDDYEQRKTKSMSYTKFDINQRKCCDTRSKSKPLKYPDEYRYQETETDFSAVCNCCDCCGKIDDQVQYNSVSTSPEFRDVETSVELSSVTESEVPQPAKGRDQPPEGKKEKSGNVKTKCKKDGDKVKKVRHKSPTQTKPCQQTKTKTVKGGAQEKKNDYYNFNKKEFMTKSELEREEKKRPTRLTLQECLSIKRPDLYTRAECRRQIISEKSKDRAERHNKRMECLTKLLPQCEPPVKNPDLKLFTSAEMRKQTRKFYKKLPEVANKQAEEKKKMQFKTNKLMAEIFAKKLQLQTLKGRMNMSNSFTTVDPQNSCGL